METRYLCRRCRGCKPSPQWVPVPLRTQANGAAKHGTTSSQRSTLTGEIRLARAVSCSTGSDGCTPPRVLPRLTSLAAHVTRSARHSRQRRLAAATSAATSCTTLYSRTSCRKRRSSRSCMLLRARMCSTAGRRMAAHRWLGNNSLSCDSASQPCGRRADFSADDTLTIESRATTMCAPRRRH